MPNDDTIILNKGVGGDITDASDVAPGPIKRERIVLGGDAARKQVADLVPNLTMWNLPVAHGPTDAFGRDRVGHPETIFDSKLINDNQPLYWDDAQTSGAGTSSTYNTNQASVTLAVSNLTAGTHVRQTFRHFLYQPGKSQAIDMTGVLGTPATGITRRLGLFDAKNGLYFESSPTVVNVVIRTFTSGVAVNTAVAQASWNIDPMNGTGPSGVTLDFSKTQIFVTDYQWLGVGTVRFGFYVNGNLYWVHAFQHANVDTLVYMSTPNLPLRYEISNDGTGAIASITQICTTVISEGRAQATGSTRAASRNATSLVTLNNTNLYPLISIRLKAGFESGSVKTVLASVICTSAADIEVQLLLNPVVTGTALAFTGITNSVVEADAVATNATTVSGGTLLNAVVASSGGQIDLSGPSDFQIGTSIAGVNDVLVLAVRRLDGNVETFYGALNWRETD